MILSSSQVKFSGNQSCRLICLTIILISCSWFKTQSVETLIKQADAIFLPKARICFNSMTTFFQSECVYCDSRLYTSTITACTGSPMLAVNVTQAQAFCIATACLQVPVSTNKLDLFKPSLLFGADEKKLARLRRFDSKLKHRFAPISATKYEELLYPHSLLHRKGVGHLRMKVDDPNSFQLESSALNESQSEPTSIKQPSVVTESATTTVATVNKPAEQPTNLPKVVVAEETRSMIYPNFNQIYAQIYGGLAQHRGPVFWASPHYHQTVVHSNNRQQMQQIQMAANQVANMMRSVSNGIALKRATIANLWQSLGSKSENWRQSTNHRPFIPILSKQIPEAHFDQDELQQTGKSPTVLGRRRRRRSLQLRPLSLSLNKSKQKANGTVTAQLNKSVNGTTVGNVAFVLNNPSSAYIWSNPITRVLTRNSPNKNLQWQFGNRGVQASASASPASGSGAGSRAPATPARPAAPAPAPARPAAAGVSSATDSGPLTSSFVVPAGRRMAGG